MNDHAHRDFSHRTHTTHSRFGTSSKSLSVKTLTCGLGFIIFFLAFDAQLACSESSCTVITSSSLPYNAISYDDAGDVNGDGVPDVLLGAPILTIWDGDTVKIVSGRDGTMLTSMRSPRGTRDGFGWKALSIEDISGDNIRDVVVSAFVAGHGKLDIFNGKTGELLYTLIGPTRFDLGEDTDDMGDLDGDGFGDFIAGQRGLDSTGRAIVFSGVDGSIIYALNGSKGFGVAVACLEDVDNDGVHDFAVGQVSDDPGQGRIHVYSGATGARLYIAAATYAFDNLDNDIFGVALGSVGDINLDGSTDFIVGAPNDGHIGIRFAGRADVYSGKDGAFMVSLWPDTSLPSYQKYKLNQFGSNVSGGTDLDGDGVPDMVVGNSFAQDQGRAYIFSGADYSTITLITGSDNGHSSDVGATAAIVGDINGDCINDLALSNSLIAFQNTCARPASCAAGCCNIPGDASGDNSFNIADVPFSIARIFSGGPSPACQDEADANGDNMFNIADVTYGIARIFSGGLMPVCGSTGL